MHTLLRFLIVPACAAIGVAVGAGVFELDRRPSGSGDADMIRGMVQFFAGGVGLLIGAIVGLVWAIRAPHTTTWRPLSRDDLIASVIVSVVLVGGLILIAPLR